MSDINQGDYIIQYYTVKGTKLKNHTEVHTGSRVEALEMCEETLALRNALSPIHSFTIDMRMFNSLDGDVYGN